MKSGTSLLFDPRRDSGLVIRRDKEAPDDTLDVYGHMFPGTDEETAARLDERLRAAQGGHTPDTADVVDLPRRDRSQV